jgi:DNA-binding MarR family transcriptional regulator
MTSQPALTGQDIGATELALRALLDRLLAQHATTFPQWVVLATTGTPGRVSSALVNQRLVGTLKLDQTQAASTLAELVDGGLVASDGDNLTLTPTGVEHFEHIRDGVAAITDRIYGGLPVDDLLTTRRILTVVRERADAELAGAGSGGAV